MTLLGVVDNLNHRIESLDSSSSNDQEGIEERGSGDTGNPEVDGLSNQLAEIENVDDTSWLEGYFGTCSQYPFSILHP
jgi:hypothetical protein